MVTIRHGDRDRDDKDNDGDDGDGDANDDADADDADGDGDADDGGKDDGNKCAMLALSLPTPCMTFSSIELGDSTCTATLLEAIGGSHWIGVFHHWKHKQMLLGISAIPKKNIGPHGMEK